MARTRIDEMTDENQIENVPVENEPVPPVVQPAIKRGRGRPIGSTVEYLVLTKRQLEIVKLFAEDLEMTNQKAADILEVSVGTIIHQTSNYSIKKEINRLRTHGINVEAGIVKRLDKEIITNELKALVKFLVDTVKDTEVPWTARINAQKELKKFLEDYAESKDIHIEKFIEIPKRKHAMMEKGFAATRDIAERVDRGDDISFLWRTKLPGGNGTSSAG